VATVWLPKSLHFFFVILLRVILSYTLLYVFLSGSEGWPVLGLQRVGVPKVLEVVIPAAVEVALHQIESYNNSNSWFGVGRSGRDRCSVCHNNGRED